MFWTFLMFPSTFVRTFLIQCLKTSSKMSQFTTIETTNVSLFTWTFTNFLHIPINWGGECSHFYVQLFDASSLTYMSFMLLYNCHRHVIPARFVLPRCIDWRCIKSVLGRWDKEDTKWWLAWIHLPCRSSPPILWTWFQSSHYGRSSVSPPSVWGLASIEYAQFVNYRLTGVSRPNIVPCILSSNAILYGS